MTITAIKAAVKTPGRFNVFVDGVYSFSLSESQVISTGIAIGKIYNQADLKALHDESTFGKAYARALEYIMRRPRSIKELRDYAWRKQWEAPMAERVIQTLLERGYLNDTTFAEAWVRHRAYGKPTSERKLRLELAQKGIAKEIINQVFLHNNDFNEQAALQKLIAKKSQRYNDKQKLIAYLARQGYSFEAITQALEQARDTV